MTTLKTEGMNMNFNFIKKILDSAVWVIFMICVAFSMVTVVAQNAYPGDSLYGFKLGYEKVMLASSKFLNRQVDLQIEYVARRFEETSKVLASNQGSASLKRLNGEVESTAYTITLIEDPEEKKVAAKKYVAQLNYVSTGLRQQRDIIVIKSQSSPQPIQNEVVPQAVNNQPVALAKTNPTPTSKPAQQTTQIVAEIDQTQQTVEQTIQEMETIIESSSVVAPSPTMTPSPTATPIPTLTPLPTSTPMPTATTSPRMPAYSIIAPTATPEPTSHHDNRDKKDNDNPTATPEPTPTI